MVAMDSRERTAAEQQLSILELLGAALERREEVFEIVESSADAHEAHERIRDLFGVRDPHVSQAVLDLQVSRWTRAERKRIADNAEHIRGLLNA